MDNMLVEEIKNEEDKKMLFEVSKEKIKITEKEISKLEHDIQEIAKVLEMEIKQYKIDFDKNRNRTITSAEFEIIDQVHRHRIDSMNLKKLSLEMQRDSKKNLKQRLLCFCWILKLPYGVKMAQMKKNGTDEKIIVNRKEIYNKFLGIIVNSEKNRLKKEQSFYRLQLDFNNTPDYLVFKNHEFYAESDPTSKKLEEVKDQIYSLKSIESKVKRNYTEFVDYNRLMVSDFTKEDNQQLYNQLFLGDMEDNLKRAM